MRRPPYQREDRGRLDVKMTPMIDVVFQLLIFFVCTVSFQAMEEVLPTHLRGAGAAEAGAPLDPELAELEEVLVKVRREGERLTWLVNERPCQNLAELRGLLGQLARLRADLPVILDVEAEVPIGDVVNVYDLCRLAGFKKIQFAAGAEA
ncbi:MAG TPA: biopolymer transporter ExbD [Pirellulales bacterium]|jgi:biopolymer transport protein ExbD|nr:biopolymer transporter ExbD [Pirellulales bacterium]